MLEATHLSVKVQVITGSTRPSGVTLFLKISLTGFLNKMRVFCAPLPAKTGSGRLLYGTFSVNALIAVKNKSTAAKRNRSLRSLAPANGF